VFESYLYGGSHQVLKENIPKIDSPFSYENSKCFLFQGTIINDCESSYIDNGVYYLKCLVVNTGINTYWGSFLQNILFRKKLNFKFYHELKIFIYFLFILYLINISVLIYSFIRKLGKSKLDLINDNDILLLQEFNKEEINLILDFLKKLCDIFTIIVPPHLHICMSVISIYFNDILKLNQITCLSEKRINVAGKVNTIVLDKTGTLTTDRLEIIGFQTTKYFNHSRDINKKIKNRNNNDNDYCLKKRNKEFKNKKNQKIDTNNHLNNENLDLNNDIVSSYEKEEDFIHHCYKRLNKNLLDKENKFEFKDFDFDIVEKSIKIYNSMHREFWMRYTVDSTNCFYKDYKYDLRNNPIYFMECLASCLSIDKLKNDKLLGNKLDVSLFQQVDWCIEKINEKWNDIEVNFIFFYILIKKF